MTVLPEKKCVGPDNSEPPVTTYVRPDNYATIICPGCGFLKELSVDDLPRRITRIRIQCKCGHQFRTLLEFRRNYRKKTQLQGVLMVNLAKEEREVVELVDLSMGGVCLEVADVRSFTVGDEGNLHFTLDDQQNTMIMKRIIVKSISNKRAHCEFVKDKVYERELGFYLRK